MEFYIPKYFKLFEVLSEVDYKHFKNKGWLSWKYFNPKLLKAMDFIREYTGEKIFINNWKFGGNLNWCGLRTKNCDMDNYKSRHFFGCAMDLHVLGYDSSEKYDKLRNKLLELPVFLELINEIEFGINWLHIGIGNHEKVEKYYL